MPYYRRNIYVLAVTIFLAGVSWNQIVPFLPLFMRQIGVQSHFYEWVGFVFAAQSIASILAMPLWGKLGDSYGRKPMIIRAGICLAGIYFGMSFCRTAWQLALCRFLNGALTGFIPSSFALIATNTPEKLAPRYVAAALSASNAGLIVGPAFGAFLASATGYRVSMQWSGAAVVLSTILVWWLVSEPNKVQPTEKTSLVQDFGISVRSPIQLSVMFAVMLSWAFGAAISPYLAVHLQDMGVRQGDFLAYTVYSLPAVAFVLSAQAWTRFGERQGYDRGIFLGLIGGAAGAVSLVFAHSVWFFALLYFLAGLWLSALSPSIGAITCTEVEQGFRARAYGIQQSAGTLGALVAPLIAGALADRWGIPAIFIFVGAAFFAGAFIFRALAAKWARKPGIKRQLPDPE